MSYCNVRLYLYLTCKSCRAKKQESYSAQWPSAYEFPGWICHGQCMIVSKSGILLANTHKLCRTERRLVWFWTVLLILFLNDSCLLNKLFEYPAFVFSGYNTCVCPSPLYTGSKKGNQRWQHTRQHNDWHVNLWKYQQESKQAKARHSKPRQARQARQSQA